MNEKLAAVMSVHRKLAHTEAAIESALAAAAELTAELPRARAAGKLSPVVGQEALEGVVNTVAHLSRARGHLVDAHARLDEVRHDVGLGDIRAFGDGVPKPSWYARKLSLAVDNDQAAG